jgi:hypothetical protein
MKFVFAESVDDVLEAALEPAPKPKAVRKRKTSPKKETADVENYVG